MRDLNISVSAFDKQLETMFTSNANVKTFFASGNNACTSTQIQDIQPIFFDKVEILFEMRKPMNVYLLAMYSWYINPVLGFQLRATIKRNLTKSTFDFRTRSRILPLIETKQLMLTFVCDLDEEISASDWYGNYKPLCKNIHKLLHFKYNDTPLKKVAKYTGYCRGYRCSPKQESLISSQVWENEVYINSWHLLKSLRERLDIVNTQAIQLKILRDKEGFNLILESLTYLKQAYESLKANLGLDEKGVKNCLDAELLFKIEEEKRFDYSY